jgi:hypothetical protein
LSYRFYSVIREKAINSNFFFVDITLTNRLYFVHQT